jgi:hypothetical protein
MHVVLNMSIRDQGAWLEALQLVVPLLIVRLTTRVECSSCSVLPGVATTAAIPVLSTFAEALPGLAYAVVLQQCALQSAFLSLTYFAHVAWFC